MEFEAKLAARDTSAGRRYEAKIIFFDCMSLVLGATGLALALPPLVYVAAAAHLVANFLVAPVKWLWPLMEAVTVAVAAALFFAALYAVQIFYYGFPSEGVLAYLKSNWPQHLASAIVLAGLIGTLFAYPGNLDQLVERMNRENA